jgi:GNAT superfamily N-acetyltransferase
MENLPAQTPRVATVAESATVAGLLDTFNREFDTPTPGTAVLTTRLERLLDGGDVVALLAGEPAVAVALLTLRPNVWYDGPVALLDELYVAPELRGRGLGSALLQLAEAVTLERGGELLEINVDGDDVDARRFYERHGYTSTEPGQDQPMLYYFRDLGGPIISVR